MLMLTNIFAIYIYFSHTPAGVVTTSFTLSVTSIYSDVLDS